MIVSFKNTLIIRSFTLMPMRVTHNVCSIFTVRGWRTLTMYFWFNDGQNKAEMKGPPLPPPWGSSFPAYPLHAAFRGQIQRPLSEENVRTVAWFDHFSHFLPLAIILLFPEENNNSNFKTLQNNLVVFSLLLKQSSRRLFTGRNV